MSEARDKAIDEVLEDIEAALKGASASLVMRSGSLFAGHAPPAVNRETYAAMAAVMVGAAETGTADLGDPLLMVDVRLKVGALLCTPVGPKLVLVVHVGDASALSAAGPKLSEAAKRLSELF